MTKTQIKLAAEMIVDLSAADWTDEEINGFIAAQEMHGVLCRSNPGWKTKAFAAAWPRYKPASRPRPNVIGERGKATAS